MEECDPHKRDCVGRGPHVDGVVSVLCDDAKPFRNDERNTECNQCIFAPPLPHCDVISFHSLDQVVSDDATGRYPIHHVAGEDEVGASLFGIEFEKNLGSSFWWIKFTLCALRCGSGKNR